MPGQRKTGLLLRGLTMGIVEVVPGVSGGTIAFITGIYRELLDTLAGLRLRMLIQVVRSPRRLWREANAGFLLCLAAGMAVGALGFARLLLYWLETAPTLVWAFLFGVILFATLRIGRGRRLRWLLPMGGLGLVAGLAMSQLQPLNPDPNPGLWFLGGFLAISAWLLPAVSGSFLLVLLGLYQPLLQALVHWHWTTLAPLAVGCATGLICCSRAVRYLLHRWPDAVLCFLTGLMAAGLMRLWPWRLPAGETGAGTGGAWMTPGAWAEATGSQMPVSIVCAMGLAGAVTFWLFSRLDRRAQSAPR